jgi:hypothetical protein
LAEQEDHQENQGYHQGDHYDRFFIALGPEKGRALPGRDCRLSFADTDDGYFSHGKLYSYFSLLYPFIIPGYISFIIPLYYSFVFGDVAAASFCVPVAGMTLWQV